MVGWAKRSVPTSTIEIKMMGAAQGAFASDMNLHLLHELNCSQLLTRGDRGSTCGLRVRQEAPSGEFAGHPLWMMALPGRPDRPSDQK